MCVDFTDLNDACPKDCFPLPRIDTLIDATTGHEMLSFMDGFSGYNQIRMDKDDTLKVSFIMDFGVFCYLVMTFGLKNAGATYQRLANKMFKHLIALNKVKNFEWMNESQVAFDELKNYMAEPPLLLNPVDDETLYVYLAVSEQALSAVLVREDGKVQKPVYYVCKVLHGVDLNYSLIEKFAMTMIITSRKLRPYFQSHKIEVLTDQPLSNVIHSPKASGSPGGGGEDKVEEPVEEAKPKEYWLLFFDGALKAKGSGAGLVLQSPDGFIVEYAIKLDFSTTNNEAEYEALIAGLGLARTLRVKSLIVGGDSKLMVFQVNGEFEAREETMLKYLRIVKAQIAQFENCLVLRTSSIDARLVAPIDTGATWMDEIKMYLENGHLPPNADEARKLQVRALKYILIEGILSFVIPYLRCLRPYETQKALREVHEGVCGQHLGGRALARKITLF
ncbi:uncharacterized protein LOC135152678 [Daucus carota subsp. sativus]|uniref:uncharacterized protein LOC135152678 n=1 Tax=Daucus carota subsp. sativus TaxID=79200 RepID=UPI00308303B5